MSGEEHTCTPEMVLDHENRITSNTDRSRDNRKRLDEFQVLVSEIHNMNTSIQLLSQTNIGVLEEMKEQRREIDDIKENQATRDTIKRIHKVMEDREIDFNNNVRKISDSLDSMDKRLTDQERKPQDEAYKQVQSIKSWIIGGAGAIILSLVSTLVYMMMNLK